MKILVVEDEQKLARALAKGLSLQGWVSENATTATDAILFLNQEEFDLVILDRMLADGSDGLEVCKHMRTNGNQSPVLFLSARNEIQDRISGLDIGADDYLGKPFDMEELYARVRALVRRPKESVGPVVEIGDVFIDLSSKKISVGSKEVKLSKKEFSLLEFLVTNRGQVLSKDQIIERVWEYDSDILPNTIEATIKNIRSKIKKYSPESNIVETVRGFGYRVATNPVSENV